ncbi:MAG TPA: hypothetical protein VML55_21920 [Planctomycetaceae bacterium]|nr:hypothetical protein [Planctomycetaceae bacterium]
MLEQIRNELQRVVGPAGAAAMLEERDDLGSAVRVDTAEAVRRLPPGELLELLRELPDRAGPLAMLDALDEWKGGPAGQTSRARGSARD